MKTGDRVACASFPCVGVQHQAYHVPNVDVDPDRVRIVVISECAPADPADGYDAGKEALFARTTLQAFQDAGADVSSLDDILDLGVYLTTAVKCGKVGYAIKAAPIKACSQLLEREIAPFGSVAAWMLMGDVAIKAVNYIARRAGQGRVIPAGSTYKIRGETYSFRGGRAFPSYLQAGPSYFIEKSKRRMIAGDIAAALELIR
jgi:uracil-DNA glycosylase